MADKTFSLEIITPEEIFLRAEVSFLVLPEVDGEIGILYNHAPIIAALDTGVVRYVNEEGETRFVAIGGGFFKFLFNEARVLAEIAELGEDIDINRARKSLERARARLEARDENLNYTRAELSMKRALTRLKAAESELSIKN